MKEDLLTKMKEDRKADQEKIAADKEDFLARIGQQTKDLMSHINQSTQILRTELTDAIQKTQIELQTVEICIDKRTRCVEEDIEAIREDITANKQKVQSQLEEVKVIAERGSRPTLSASTAQPPTFDGRRKDSERSPPTGAGAAGRSPSRQDFLGEAIAHQLAKRR
jgi:hypothetical protein